MAGRKLAVIYDTANVLSRISCGKIKAKHLLSPLLVPTPAWLVVGILPVEERDLAPLKDWKNLLENVIQMIKNKLETFNLFKNEEEFSNYLSDIKLMLKDIKVEKGRGRIVNLREKNFAKAEVIVDYEPKITGKQEEVNFLLQVCKKVDVCKKANPEEAVEDIEIYVLPYVWTLKEHNYKITIVSSDYCFQRLVSIYSERNNLEIKVLPAELLSNVHKLISELSST
jgi:hypothetical protein